MAASLTGGGGSSGRLSPTICFSRRHERCSRRAGQFDRFVDGDRLRRDLEADRLTTATLVLDTSGGINGMTWQQRLASIRPKVARSQRLGREDPDLLWPALEPPAPHQLASAGMLLACRAGTGTSRGARPTRRLATCSYRMSKLDDGHRRHLAGAATRCCLPPGISTDAVAIVRDLSNGGFNV